MPRRSTTPGRNCSSTQSAVEASLRICLDLRLASSRWRSFLVAIDLSERRAPPGYHRRTVPGRISDLRLFDLDYFGAKIGKHQSNSRVPGACETNPERGVLERFCAWSYST